jgi:hypothetical protein
MLNTFSGEVKCSRFQDQCVKLHLPLAALVWVTKLKVFMTTRQKSAFAASFQGDLMKETSSVDLGAVHRVARVKVMKQEDNEAQSYTHAVTWNNVDQVISAARVSSSPICHG